MWLVVVILLSVTLDCCRSVAALGCAFTRDPAVASELNIACNGETRSTADGLSVQPQPFPSLSMVNLTVITINSLYIINYHLAGLHAHSFARLCIRRLTIANNRIVGNVSRHLFERMRPGCLRSLEFASNHIDGHVDARFLRPLAASLRTAVLANNKQLLVVSSSSSNALNPFYRAAGELAGLEVLSLEGAGLHDLNDDAWLARHSSLVALNVARNSIGSLAPRLFAHTPRLAYITLAHNRLTDSGSSSSSTLASALGHVRHSLKELRLQHNKHLATIPIHAGDDDDDGVGFVSLEYLDVSACGLRGTWTREWLEGMNKVPPPLRFLAMNGNAIESIEPGAVWPLRHHLTHLELSHNSLRLSSSSVGASSLAALVELTALYLDNNELSAVPHIATLTKLAALDVSRQRVSYFGVRTRAFHRHSTSTSATQPLSVSIAQHEATTVLLYPRALCANALAVLQVSAHSFAHVAVNKYRRASACQLLQMPKHSRVDIVTMTDTEQPQQHDQDQEDEDDNDPFVVSDTGENAICNCYMWHAFRAANVTLAHKSCPLSDDKCHDSLNYTNTDERDYRCHMSKDFTC